MQEITEADEIRAQRAHPTSHPLQSRPLEQVRKLPSLSAQTTLIISDDASSVTGMVFRRCARELVNMRSHPTVHLWFWNEHMGRADYATGTLRSWSDDGEINFLGGTRLNDKLLMRVTF